MAVPPSLGGGKEDPPRPLKGLSLPLRASGGPRAGLSQRGRGRERERDRNICTERLAVAVSHLPRGPRRRDVPCRHRQSDFTQSRPLVVL